MAGRNHQWDSVCLQAEQLLKLQDSQPDGVVGLSTAAFNRFAALRSRPYQLAVFVTAKHLLDKPQLKLRDLRNEWGYLAKAFAKDPAVRGKVRPPHNRPCQVDLHPDLK